MTARAQLIVLAAFLAFAGAMAISGDEAKAFERPSSHRTGSDSEDPPGRIVKVRQADGTQRWQLEDPASIDTFGSLSGGGRQDVSVNAVFVEHAAVNDGCRRNRCCARWWRGSGARSCVSIIRVSL